MTARKGKDYIAAADFLRVFAVGLVACFHIWQQSWLDPGFRLGGVYFDLQRLIRRGYMAVDLMLLLSGFLLYLPVARSGKMPDTRAFYGKRLRRILPSYLFALLAALVFARIYGREPGSPALWQDLAAHLTFTHTFWRSTYYWTSLNAALWTLAVEMQFYLLFPLVGRAFLKAPRTTFAAMTALGLAAGALAAGAEDIGMVFNQLPCMLQLYACGMLSAHLLIRCGGKLPGWLSAAGSAACLWGILWLLLASYAAADLSGSGLKVLSVRGSEDGVLNAAAYEKNRANLPADARELNVLQIAWRLPLGMLGGGFLWCGAQWGPILSRAAGSRVTKFCAGISYNFYIWHQYLAVKLKTWRVPPYTSQLPQMSEGRLWQMKYTALCFAAAIAAAAILTYFIEKPAYRLTEPAGGKHTMT